MEDVKGKMKGLIKKVNKPFSSSSSPFKGQGRVLGSAPPSSIPPNHTSSRLLPPTSASITATKIPSGFHPDETLDTSSEKSASSASIFECPICSSSFPSEESVSAHLDSCINLSADADVAKSVDGFLSGEPAEASVEIVIKLLRNVVREPGNEKFRKIRMGNPKIKEAIGDAIGGVGLLECVGFRIREEDGDKWATMGEPTQERIAVIQEAVSLLGKWKGKGTAVDENGTVERLVPKKEREQKTIDRKVRVFFSVPESVAAKIDLPDYFYNLSVEELRREADARKKKIADSQVLIPKSYKKKQAMTARKNYKLSVIRIQFPDGVVLQGVFLPWELTTALYEFVSSALKDPTLEFELLSPAISRVHLIPRFSNEDGRTATLEEENLVPSALIKFKPIETDSVVFTGLANEFLELIEPLTTEAATVL